MAAGRPNVLFITLDQFRAECLSAAGHPVVRTPAIDELAAAGVRFARHYAQAAPCGPGRAALYTGTYQMNNRVVMNGSPLDDRFDNLARAARRAGYDPVLFGYTDQAVDPRTVDDPDDPRLLTYEGVLPGFAVELDLTGHRSPWAEHLRAAGFDVPDDPDDALATEPSRPAEVGVSAFLTDRFLEWLAHQDRPWFAHLSHLRPHPPYAAAGEWSTVVDPASVPLPISPVEDRHPVHDLFLSFGFCRAPTDEDAQRHMRAQYYGMIGDVDLQLGRVWAALRDSGQWDDTVVVLTADHAEQLGDHGLTEKFGWFEQSFHIPLVIRDPRRRGPGGAVVGEFTEAVDVFPTLCESMGIDIPRQCDGRSLGAFLDGDRPAEWRDAATWEFDWRFFVRSRGSRWPYDRRSVMHHATVRRSDDLALVQFATGGSILYDLAADPTWRTTIDDGPRELEAARAMLAWRAQHADRTLTDTFIGPWG